MHKKPGTCWWWKSLDISQDASRCAVYINFFLLKREMKEMVCFVSFLGFFHAFFMVLLDFRYYTRSLWFIYCKSFNEFFAHFESFADSLIKNLFINFVASFHYNIFTKLDSFMCLTDLCCTWLVHFSIICMKHSFFARTFIIQDMFCFFAQGLFFKWNSPLAWKSGLGNWKRDSFNKFLTEYGLLLNQVLRA